MRLLYNEDIFVISRCALIIHDVIIHAVIIHFINNIICVDIRLIIYVSSIIMICGVLDDMKTSILIGFVFLFSAIIIYYLHERIVYLEKSVSKQNEVLSDFISNVQRQVCSAPPHHHESLDARDNIKVISQMDVNPFEKIVISDKEQLSDSWFKSEILGALENVSIDWVDPSSQDGETGIVSVHLSTPNGSEVLD
jgi:hypothetical protein